jgi:hypothetical protein
MELAVIVCALVAAGSLWLIRQDRAVSHARIARLERDLALALAARDAQDWSRRVAEADETARQREAGTLDKDGIERVPTSWEEAQADRRDKYRERTKWARM